MRFPKFSSLLISVSLAMPGVGAFAQANVTGNQTALLYVDALNGSDINPGTKSMPLKTIQTAVQSAQANNWNSVGTKVIINPGIYRELVKLQANWKETAAPMSFEAAQPGTAVIAGSDSLTGWVQSSTNPGIYDHPWNYTFGNCQVPASWPSTFAPIALRTEMFFLNGVPLTQVSSFSDMRAGTFQVDEGNNVVHVWPSSPTDMNSAVVEAAVRPQTLSVSGVTNVIFKGLVFQHAANCINTSGANVSRVANVLFDHVQARWNNWGGLGISSSSHITVQNSEASHNGGVGFAGMSDTNALYDHNESDYNNWRGAMGALYDWGMGGTKLMLMHSATVTNQISYRNQAQGLWFDTDNKNINIANATLSENVMAGLQLEANEGPISVANSQLCSSGVGLNVINTAGLTVTNSSFYNNGGTGKYQGQIFIAGKPGGRQISDWETGQPYMLFTTNTTLKGNNFIDASPGQYVFATYLSGNDWSQFTASISSDNNGWYEPTSPLSFKIPGIRRGLPTDLSGWRSNVRSDFNSAWQPSPALATACAVPAASFADFNVNVDKSGYTMTGGQAVVTLHVNSFGYGPVTLSTSALPTGVIARFDHPTLVGGVAVLALVASQTAPVQSAPLTIFANSGGRVHTVTVSLAVLPSPPPAKKK